MAELTTLARPYANAVFDIAKHQGRLDAWSRVLSLLAAAAREPGIAGLIASPSATVEEKADKLGELVGEELDQHVRRFLGVLAANKRLGLLEEIAELYEERKAQEERRLDVEVVSAFPLSAGERDALLGALGRRFEREIDISELVDEALIGGAVIRAGDRVIDGSVRGKLERLRETIQRA